MLFFPVYNESDPRPLFGLPLTADCTLFPFSYSPNPLPCPPKIFKINTCKSVSKQTTLTPIRMNTYEKHRGEGAPPTFPSRNARKHFAHPLFFSTTCAMPFSQPLSFDNHPFSWGVYPPQRRTPAPRAISLAVNMALAQTVAAAWPSPAALHLTTHAPARTPDRAY